MKNNKLRTTLSLIFLSILVVFAIGSVDDSDSKKPIGEMPEGNRILINATDKGTTLQREDLQAQYRGKTLVFQGKVEDVVSSLKAEIQIDASHYANVKFTEPEARSLQIGQQINFTATIGEFGSGILIKHDLINAQLTK